MGSPDADQIGGSARASSDEGQSRIVVRASAASGCGRFGAVQKQPERMTDLRRFSIGVRLIDEVVMACPHTALKSTWMNRCSGPVMMTPRSGGLRLVDRLREAYPDADVSLFVLHDTHLEHARVDLRISVAHYSIVNNVAHDQRHRRCGLR